MGLFNKFFSRAKLFLVDLKNDWRDLWRLGPGRWFLSMWHDLAGVPRSLAGAWKRKGAVLLLPKRCFLAIGRELREIPVSIAESRERRREERALREGGFKKAMITTWDAYVSFVAGLLNWFTSRWRRFLARPLWVRSIVLASCLFLIAGGVSSPWIWKSVKEYRSQEMLADAKSIKESDPVTAYTKARAAALMQVDDPEALEFALELSNDLGTPDAVWWSERIASTKGFDGASMRQIVETALRHRLTDKARQSLLSLKLRHSDYVDLAETELEVLLAQKKFSNSLNLAIGSLEAGGDSPKFHAVAVSLGLRSSSQEVQDFAINHLAENLFRDDEIGFALVRVVLHDGISPLPQVQDSVDFTRLLELVESHDEANAADRVAAIGLGLREGLIDEDTAYERIVSEYDLEEETGRISALEMLGRVGLYEFYDQLITDEDLAAREEFVLLQLAGLLLRDEANLDAVEETLQKSESGEYAQISDAKMALWSGLIAGRRGDQTAMEEGIVNAVEESKRREWIYLLSIVERMAGPEESLIVFRELYDHSGKNPYLAAGYLRLAYQYAEEEELSRLVRFLPIEVLQRDEESLALLLYLRAVFGESLTEGRRHAEELFAENPRDIRYLLTLAHLYAMSGAQDYARRLVASFTGGQIPTNLQPRSQLSFAAVTGNLAEDIDLERFPRLREREFLNQMTTTPNEGSGLDG